jgi:phosphoribosylformylglycinamidine cyclo-ligase
MGHRFEIYTDVETADEIIKISESYGVEAKVIGRVEAAKFASVDLITEFGEFTYEK